MSNPTYNQAAEEQAFRDLMEGHHADEFSEDDGAEEAVHVRRSGATADQVDDEDMPPLTPS